MSLTWIFDLGTTYCKAVAFSAAGQARCVCRRPTPLLTPGPGRVEMNPDAFGATLKELVADGRRQLGPGFDQITRVSFATQANTFCLLDADDEPVTPWIVWTDRRAEGLDLPAIDDYAVTGIPAITGAFSPAKLRWLREHSPEAWRPARRVMYLGDGVTHRLTGRHAAAADVAGLTGLLNVHDLTWREPAIAALGLDRLTFPAPTRPGTDLGPLDPSAAAALGLPPGARFHVGCLDQYAAAYAADLPRVGGVCETTGTVLATVTAAPRFDPALTAAGIYQGPAAPAGYFRMLFGDVSARLLADYRQRHAPNLTYEHLDARAANPDDRGPHGPAVRAIYRRVAQALQQQLAALAPDPPPRRVVSLGGGARSHTWRQIKAELIGLPHVTLPTQEPTAYGVYRLITPAASAPPR
jgi:sugar (pentulose or hexulose) kinase